MKIQDEATRLTFKRDIIEPLSWDDRFSIHVSNEGQTFTMSKREFYNVFDNVVASKSYKEKGTYNYETTPKKAMQFLTTKKKTRQSPSYEAARLTFKRDVIEPLEMEEEFSVHVSNENATYKMTKRDFYRVFDNVVNSKSYQKLGNYNYQKTPKKACPFRSIQTSNSTKKRKKGFLGRLFGK